MARLDEQIKESHGRSRTAIRATKTSLRRGVEFALVPVSGVMIGLVETAEVPQEVARLRHQFADRIVALDETAWDEASWCSGWQVRDVLAHLVKNAESTPWSMMGDLLQGGFRPDHSVNKAAKRLRGVPVPSWLKDSVGRLTSGSVLAVPRKHSAWATLSFTVQTHFGH